MSISSRSECGAGEEEASLLNSGESVTAARVGREGVAKLEPAAADLVLRVLRAVCGVA